MPVFHCLGISVLKLMMFGTSATPNAINNDDNFLFMESVYPQLNFKSSEVNRVSITHEKCFHSVKIYKYLFSKGTRSVLPSTSIDTLSTVQRRWLPW